MRPSGKALIFCAYWRRQLLPITVAASNFMTDARARPRHRDGIRVHVPPPYIEFDVRPERGDREVVGRVPARRHEPAGGGVDAQLREAGRHAYRIVPPTGAPTVIFAQPRPISTGKLLEQGGGGGKLHAARVALLIFAGPRRRPERAAEVRSPGPSGHWDRTSSIVSFSSVPASAARNRRSPFTPEGRR